MNISLKGKSALVGGSSRGLGYAVARQLAISGASVTLMSRNEKKLKEIIANLENETKIKHNYLIVDFNNFDSFSEKFEDVLIFLEDKNVDIKNIIYQYFEKVKNKIIENDKYTNFHFGHLLYILK